jgi:hypothetical protein
MQQYLLVIGALLAGAAGLQAAPPPPAVVVLALDTSGSITASDAERTRALAADLLAALPAGSEVALLTFDDQSRIVVPRTAVAADLKAGLATIRISGRYTALYDALYEASRYLRGTPPARKAVVLVTDGRDENSALNLDDGLGDARDSGIPIFTIGIGKAEERVLRRIAKLTGGEYTPVGAADASQLATRILAIGAPEALPEPTRAPPPTTAPAPEPARGRTALGLVLIGATLLAVVLVLMLLAARRAPATPATGTREIPVATERLPRPRLESPVDDGYSPTLMTRLDTGEESLEKTMTFVEKPMLVVQGGPLSGHFFVLKRETTTAVGRARANDVVLDDVAVSSQHCRIRHEEGDFVLHDLQSTNGTYVNEQKVSRHRLAAGDVIRLGETQLLFKREPEKSGS